MRLLEKVRLVQEKRKLTRSFVATLEQPARKMQLEESSMAQRGTTSRTRRQTGGRTKAKRSRTLTMLEVPVWVQRESHLLSRRPLEKASLCSYVGGRTQPCAVSQLHEASSTAQKGDASRKLAPGTAWPCASPLLKYWPSAATRATPCPKRQTSHRRAGLALSAAYQLAKLWGRRTSSRSPEHSKRLQPASAVGQAHLGLCPGPRCRRRGAKVPTRR